MKVVTPRQTHVAATQRPVGSQKIVHPECFVLCRGKGLFGYEGKVGHKILVPARKGTRALMGTPRLNAYRTYMVLPCNAIPEPGIAGPEHRSQCTPAGNVSEFLATIQNCGDITYT